MSDLNSLQKAHQLNEYRRRHAITQLKRELSPIVGEEWWWCRNEVLTEIQNCFKASGTHAVIDRFLGSASFFAVLEEIRKAHASSLLNTPGLVGGGERGVASQSYLDNMVRSDTIGWFDCSSTPEKASSCQFEGVLDSSVTWPHLALLLSKMETLVAELGLINAPNDFSGCSTRSRCMITLYKGSPGDESRYTRHYDNANRNGRRVTAIYYANNDWTRASGGQLRMYSQDINPLYVDVEPVADRLVLFYSDMRCLHEVLPAHADRYALTVWFFDRIEKADAKNRHEFDK